MIALSVLLGLIAIVLLLPSASDLLSVVKIALGRRPTRPHVPEAPPRLLFLVPAHNEELLIESCVRSLVRLRYPTTRASVVVIADNCSDRTAPLARAAGARCLERHDQSLPGKRVLAEHGWDAFSICEDWEMYALLSERGVPIECVPTAHVYAQEAQSLRQSSTQRQRWTAGKLTVLARLGRRLLLSRRIGTRQKLDAMAELAVPGPALHLGIVLVAAVTAVALHPPGALALVAASAASLLRPVVYTIAALALQPDPARAVRAFAFLPLYAVWRLGAAARAPPMVGDKPWVRTVRHQQGGA